MPAVKVLLDVEKVHRAALAPGQACLFAQQLRRAPHGIGTAHQGVPVIAVGSDHVIIRPCGMLRRHRHRLLADIQVTETTDMPLLVQLGHPLLETPDQEHFPVHLEQLLLGERLGRLDVVKRSGYHFSLLLCRG